MPQEIFTLHTIVFFIIERPQLFKYNSLFSVVVVQLPFCSVMGYSVAALSTAITKTFATSP
jgi:hypothetical protein